MSTLPVTPWMTASEFGEHSEYEHGWELVEGRPVFMGNTKQLHEAIKMAIAEALILYKSTQAAGTLAVWVESAYRLDTYNLRMPDVSVTVPARALPEEEYQSYFQHPPEIMAEVISPSNTVAEIDRKVRKFFEHGTREAWIVDAERRKGYRVGTHGDWQQVGEFTAPELLPRLSIAVEALWPSS